PDCRRAAARCRQAALVWQSRGTPRPEDGAPHRAGAGIGRRAGPGNSGAQLALTSGMTPGLCRCLLAVSVATASLVVVGADGREPSPAESPLLQRFLANPDPPPTAYRALRHLEARNDHFDSAAWMDVWTEAAGAGGFRY